MNGLTDDEWLGESSMFGMRKFVAAVPRFITAMLIIALHTTVALLGCSSYLAAQALPIEIKLRSNSPANSPIATALAYSAKHNTLAVGGDDHSIQIVRMSDISIQKVLWHHQDWIKSLDYSSDGEQLLSAGDDGKLCTWNCADYSVSSSLAQVHHSIFAARYWPGDPLELNELAFVGFSGDLYMGNQRKVVNSKAMAGGELRTLAVAKNGKQLATAGSDGRLYVIDRTGLNVGQIKLPEIVELAAHSKRVWQVAYMPGDLDLVSCAEDGTLVVSNLLTKQATATVTIPKCKLRSLAVLNSRYVATAGSDNNIYIVDIERQMTVQRLAGHTGTVCALQECGAGLVSGSYDSTLLLWNVDAFR